MESRQTATLVSAAPTGAIPAIFPLRRQAWPWPTFNAPMILASLVLAVTLLSAALPGAIAPVLPTDMDMEAILAPPSPLHWMGTDHFGRDITSLLIYGARQTLLMGGCSVILGLSVGGLIGLLSGYAGGVADMIIMRVIDIWMSVPYILMAIVIATALGASFGHTILAIGVITIPRYARVMRSRVLMVANQPFIEASRSIGSSPLSIILHHLLPHTLAPMLVMVTLGVAEGILVGASLSFVGLGVIEDRPDWGFLLSQGRNYVTVAWWFATFPGLALTLIVISVNIVGDWLRKRLDPRLMAR